jgi:hypothetical protein
MTDEHRLKNNACDITSFGVIARCTCGWNSGPRFSGMVARAIFQQHQEDEQHKANPAPKE